MDIKFVKTEKKASGSAKLNDMASRLKSLGLDKAAVKLESAEKMKIAYGKYLFVSDGKINAFNEKLRKDTLKEDKNAYVCKQLIFIPLAEYTEVPPDHVLVALESALADGCFDEFEVAKIEWIKEFKDPIVFGKINCCSDHFFISQWDDDVRVEDLLFMETPKDG